MNIARNECAPHEFLELLFARVPSGAIEVTYIAPEGVDLYPHAVIQWRDLPLGDIDPAMPNVHILNQRGYSCYFAPVVRKQAKAPEQRISKKTGKTFWMQPRGTAQDALYIPALWADIDLKDWNGDKSSAVKSLFESPIMPSVVIASGGGFHAYWLLESPLLITDDNRDMIKQTLRGIALYHGSDTKVAELARIMRLPGTVNTKPERGGAMCQIIDIIPGAYHYMDLELTYAPFAAPKLPPPTRNMHIPADRHIPQWVENYLAMGEKPGNRNERLYAAMRSLLDNGFSTSEAANLCKNRALADGLSDGEADRTIESAVRAPRGTAYVDRHMSVRMGAADKRARDLRF